MILCKCYSSTLQRGEGKSWKEKILMWFGRRHHYSKKKKKNTPGQGESSVSTPNFRMYLSLYCQSDVEDRRIRPPASPPFLLWTLLSHRDLCEVSATEVVDHQRKGSFAREGFSFPWIPRNSSPTD